MSIFNDFSDIIFDCDGVILDSNKFKINAMHQALISISDNKFEINRAIKSFSKNFGLSRYHHIKEFKKIFSIDFDSNFLLGQYELILKKKYKHCKFTNGFKDFLKTIQNKNLYIVSGSNQNELQDIFNYKNTTDFIEILGSPEKKSNNIRKIIDKYNINKNKVCYVGDSRSDIMSSIENKIVFVGYIPYSNDPIAVKDLCKRENFNIIDSWKNL